MPVRIIFVNKIIGIITVFFDSACMCISGFSLVHNNNNMRGIEKGTYGSDLEIFSSK